MPTTEITEIVREKYAAAATRAGPFARAALVFIGRITFAAHGQQQRMHPGCVHGMHVAHALKNLRHQRPCEFVDKVAKDRIFLRRAAHPIPW